MKKEKSSYYYSLDDMLSIFKDHIKKREDQMKIDLERFSDAEWTKCDTGLLKNGV